MSELLARLPWFLADYARLVLLPGLAICLLVLVLDRLCLGGRLAPARKRLWGLALGAVALPWGLAAICLAGQTGALDLQWWLFEHGGADLQALKQLLDQVILFLVAAWLAGLVLSLALLGSRYLASWQLVQLARRTSLREMDQDLLAGLQARLDNLAAGLGLGPVRLLLTELSPGPAAWGLGQPVVMLPVGLARELASDPLDLVLLHELGHHRHQDLPAGLVADLMVAVLWFNPAVWLARGQWLACCEEANDRLALACKPRTRWQDYGATLIQVLEWQDAGMPVAGSRAMAASKKEFTRRFRSLQVWSARPGGEVEAARAGTGPATGDNAPAGMPSPPRSGYLGIRRLVVLGALAAFVLTHVATCVTYVPAVADLPPDRFDRNYFYQLAGQLGDRLQWDRAAAVYRCILLNRPGDEAATHRLAKILLMQGRYQDVLTVLDGVEKDSGSVHTLKAKALDFQGRHDLALPEYGRGLELTRYEATRSVALAGLERQLSHRKQLPQAVCPDRLVTDRQAWTAWSTGCAGLDDEALAFDSSSDTRWSSGVPMAPGMTFTLDLGGERMVCRLALVDDAAGNTVYVEDYPREYTVEGAAEDGWWHVLGGGEGWPDRYAGAAWEPRPIRYLRVSQHGRTQGELWSIHNIMVFEASP